MQAVAYLKLKQNLDTPFWIGGAFVLCVYNAA